ncbi:MAG: SCO family protein [Bryobacteraceae bacterium]
MLAALTACHRAPQLATYGVISPFQLTSQDGREFTSHALDGNVWVADFFFTHCLGPCPRMESQMRKIQMAVASYSNVRLVSFTVDPSRDTPVVLAAYSKHFQAVTGRWFFLTGPQATLQRLCRNEFLLGSVDGSLMHSTRFVLVDRRGRIRGYYETAEKGTIGKLISDVKALAAEPS